MNERQTLDAASVRRPRGGSRVRTSVRAGATKTVKDDGLGAGRDYQKEPANLMFRT